MRYSEQFTQKQMEKLERQMCHIVPRIQFGNGAFGIGCHGILINGKGFLLKNLKRISLNFHPRAAGSHPDTVIGRVTVIVELKKPHVLMEEPILSEEITVPYRIYGQEITYQYPYLLEVIFANLQACLKDKNDDMMPYIEKISKCMEKYKEKKTQIKEERKAQEAQRKAEAKRAEEVKRAEEARKEEAGKRAEEAKKRAEERKAQEKKKDAFCEEERTLFQLGVVYTQTELRKKRRTLLRQCHPDAGGSEEMAKKINTAYDVLWKYAAVS